MLVKVGWSAEVDNRGYSKEIVSGGSEKGYGNLH
jgi:hypothetical protein